jgi:hypothetical protein
MPLSTARPRPSVFAHAPALSVVDRVLAIPNGVEFMCGRGLVRLSPQRRERAGLAFAALLQRLGGREVVIEKLAPYFAIAGDDGNEAALLALRAIERGFFAAKERNRGLILLDCMSR